MWGRWRCLPSSVSISGTNCPMFLDAEPPTKAGWSADPRSHQAFAVSQFDSSDETETYEIFRHPEGGRKDVFRWTARDDRQAQPVAELEIYRPGGESATSGPAIAEIAARMDPGGRHEAGGGRHDRQQIRPCDAAAPCRRHRRCAFLSWLRQTSSTSPISRSPAGRARATPCRRGARAISCMLNRLMLLTAGNDAKLAELFARAELRRGNCAAAASAVTADWVSAAESPRLRGAL